CSYSLNSRCLSLNPPFLFNSLKYSAVLLSCSVNGPPLSILRIRSCPSLVPHTFKCSGIFSDIAHSLIKTHLYSGSVRGPEPKVHNKSTRSTTRSYHQAQTHLGVQTHLAS